MERINKVGQWSMGNGESEQSALCGSYSPLTIHHSPPSVSLSLPAIMTINFTYDKKQVLQALRYHFLSKKEIRLMIILVNVFALASVVLFYTKKILPFAFLVGSLLWFGL